MKKRTPLYLAILGAFVLIFVEIARYSYINRGLMRQENVSHLQASYAQVARTFALFAERNWKLLDEWDTDMPNQLYDLTSEEAWSIIRDKAGVVSLKRGNSFLVQKKHSDYENPNACGRM